MLASFHLPRSALISFGECFALFSSFGYCSRTYKGPSGNLFPTLASVNIELPWACVCSLAAVAPCWACLGFHSYPRQGRECVPLHAEKPTRQGVHKALKLTQEFLPSFSCGVLGWSGFWGAFFSIYFPAGICWAQLWLLSSAFVICVQEYKSMFHFPD